MGQRFPNQNLVQVANSRLEYLVAVLVMIILGIGLLVEFDRVVLHQRSLLGTSPQLWVFLGVFYFIAQLILRVVTGIGHYTGVKQALAIVDLGLLSAILYGTGGMESPFVIFLILQVGAFSISVESERSLESSRHWAERLAPIGYLWYLPALFLAWSVPVFAWKEEYVHRAQVSSTHFHVVAAAQVFGLALFALLVRGASRLSMSRVVARVREESSAEMALQATQVLGEQPAPGPKSSQARDEEEVANWINLTAGLTHAIGNEINAIDIYSSEILEFIESHPEIPADIGEKVTFIHDTNKARFGFMSFLQEFAENMKSAQGRRPIPRNLKPIPLDDLLRDVRQKVGRFESRELDVEDPDHQVQAQLAKNLHLEVITKFEPSEKRFVTKGRIPVLNFVLYEFIKNALRNCSGQLKLKALVETHGEWITINLINDLNVESRKPPPGKPGLGCSQCKRTFAELFRVANSDFLDAFCDDCLRNRVEANLTECWEPGKTSQWGKGLGLFVIRYFLRKYYFGQTECGIINWPTREVYFRLTIPDDLEGAIVRYNTRFDTRALQRRSQP